MRPEDLTLHAVDLSPFGQRVKIVLNAKGILHEVSQISTPPDAKALQSLSPLLRIPVLDIAGERLPESGVIAEYLNDAFPSPPLLPDGAAARARCRLLVQIADLYLTGPFLDLITGMRPPARPTDMREAWAAMRTGLGYVEAYLTAGPFAVGDQLTLADAALAPLLFHTANLGASHGFHGDDERTAWRAYLDRVKADTSVETAFAEMDAAYAERVERLKT